MMYNLRIQYIQEEQSSRSLMFCVLYCFYKSAEVVSSDIYFTDLLHKMTIFRSKETWSKNQKQFVDGSNKVLLISVSTK